MSDFLRSCDPRYLILRECVRALPADGDDERWRQMVRIRSWCGPNLTDEQHRHAEEESDRRIREGVRLFRLCENL